MPQTLGARYLLAQGAGTVYEPVRKHSWEVTISAVGNSSASVTLAAQSVTLPKYDNAAHEIWHMNERVQYAGRGKAADINVKCLDVFNPNMITAFWNYWSTVYNVNSAGVGASTGPIMGFATNYKSTITFIQYDIVGNPVRSWTSYGCWPKGSPAPGGLAYTGDDALDFEVVFAQDYFVMTPTAS